MSSGSGSPSSVVTGGLLLLDNFFKIRDISGSYLSRIGKVGGFI